MFIYIISVVLTTTGAVDVRGQAHQASPRGGESLLELQSSWVQRDRPPDVPPGAPEPASLLRSERKASGGATAAVAVSEKGQISAMGGGDDTISIEELLKDEVVKQEKRAEELLNIPKVVGCAGTAKGDVPHGFVYPENYPTQPAWDVKTIWDSNKAGLYGKEVQNARYVAVTLAEQQPDGGYYYLVFGDQLSEIGTKLNLPMSDCNFGEATGKFLKTGARPDSEPRAMGNVSTSWGGTTWRIYANPVPRESPKHTDKTLFGPIDFPSLDAQHKAAASETRQFTRNHSDEVTDEKADPFLIKIKGLSGATTTPKATLHSDVQEIKQTLQGLMEEIEAMKVAGAAMASKSDDGSIIAYDDDEDTVDIKDLYLAGRLLPKKGHFQIDGDGSSSIHEDGVNLRLDPGTSPSPLGGDNDLLVNLAGYNCSRFFGSLRITKPRPAGAKGITFFTFQDAKNIGSVLVGGRTPKEFPFRYGLDPQINNLSLRVHDHGTPDKDFFEVEGYLSCKVDCTSRAPDTDTGSCESLTDDRLRCEGATDDHGRPCQWNGASCLSIQSGRCSRETLCYLVLDGTNDCYGRSDYDSCTQRTDSSGTLCGWKDKDQKCFTTTFNCKASHGEHNLVTTTPFTVYKEYVTEGKTSAYDMVS